jgi:hypothetical protein
LTLFCPYSVPVDGEKRKLKVLEKGTYLPSYSGSASVCWIRIRLFLKRFQIQFVIVRFFNDCMFTA